MTSNMTDKEWAISQAKEAVKKGTNQKQAAALYGVPRSTLRDRLNGVESSRDSY